MDDRRIMLRDLGNMGLAEECDFIEREKALKSKWGVLPSPFDVGWSILNGAVLEAMKKVDLQKVNAIQYQMARILFERGKPHLKIQRAASTAALRAYQQAEKVIGVKMRVEVVADLDGCSQCLQVKGRVFTLIEAIKSLPIPVPLCEHGLCHCQWIADNSSLGRYSIA